MEEKIYYPELDTLRFFAFLAVFIHHGPTTLAGISGYSKLRMEGWVGVDLFFCLSAFLFVHLLSIEWQKTGKIQIFYFYMRRALRIMPVYFFYLAAVFVYTYLTIGHSEKRLLYFLSAGTFTANILDAAMGYLYALPLLLALWTISYEEQFYSVIPWFLRYMFKKNRKHQVVVLCAIFFSGLVIRFLFLLSKVPFPAIYVLPITHFESILFGLSLGLGIFDPLLKRLSWWVSGILGVTLLYLTTLMPDYQINSWWLMARYPMIGFGTSLLVYMALCAPRKGLTTFLSWKPFVFLGKISYGLYLYHVAGLLFSIFLIKQLPNAYIYMEEETSNYLLLVSALMFTIAIATLSYHFIEKPFLKLKKRFALIQSRPV